MVVKSPARAADQVRTGSLMHGEDQRHPGRRLRALEMIEERALGGRLAGTLYLTGAATAIAMLAVPGVDHRHWRIMLVLAGIGLGLGACRFFLVPWGRPDPPASH